MPGSLGFNADDRYRTVPEIQILEIVTLCGWAYESASNVAIEASRQALQSWTELGLKFRTGPNGGRFFDPVEVNNFMKRAGLDGRDDFWVDRYVHTGRRLVSDLAEIAPGPLVFSLEFTRVFNLRSVPQGRRLRLRLPLPLNGDFIQNLEITPCCETHPLAQLHRSPGRLEIQLTTAGEPEVKLAAGLTFTAHPQIPRPGAPLAEAERALYLHPREGLIVVSERICTLAHSLAAPSMPPLDALRAFWEYISRELVCGALHYDQIDSISPCDWILDSGWYDCQLGASLLVALCRARGIPARVLGGYVLYRLAPSMHYWAEVWIEDQGWTPFDFLSWDLAVGGRDPLWRDHFFGRLDARMPTQCLPRCFTGALGVPIPQSWHLLQVATPGGLKATLMDLEGTPLYSDTFRWTT